MLRTLVRYGIFIGLLTTALPAFSQVPDTSLNKVNTDTIYNFNLKEFVFTDSDSAYRAKYNRYLYYVTRTYPYAKIAKQLLNEYNQELAEMNSKREARKYVNTAYDELKDKFTNGIKVMSENQGKVLVKLIYRETGMTAYTITQEYLGSFRALMWQTISRAGGANLKIEYDPTKGDDIIIEQIVQKIERKEIFVPEEPFSPSNVKAYKKQQKQAIKARQNEQKQAAKQNKNLTKQLVTTNTTVRN